MVAAVKMDSFNHMNQVTPPEYQAVFDRYSKLMDGQYLMKVENNGYVDPFLMNVGGAVIEYFVPVNMTTGMGKAFNEKGGFLHGCEFKVPNLEEAIEQMKENNVRVIIDGRPNFVMTRPSDCLGICFELYEGDWYDPETAKRYVEPMRPQSWWADEHPLGVKSFGFSVAVRELDAAVQRLAEVGGGKELRRERRPDANAETAFIQYTNIIVELTAPIGPGAVQGFLDRYGQLTRAFQFKVKDVGAVRDYFAGKGVTLERGDFDGSWVLPPAQNFGSRYEFAAG